MKNNSSYVAVEKINRSFLSKGPRFCLQSLDIELTERCNNRCVHCCINLAERDLAAMRRELPTEKIKDILREAVSLGCSLIRYTGGEPLLRKDFEELYVLTRKLGLWVVLYTNGTLITPRLAKLFSRIPPLKKIEITLYGMKKRSCESVTRTPGSFDRALRGVQLLLKYKVPFVVKGAYLPQNKNEVDAFEKWAATIPGMDKPVMHAVYLDLSCRRKSFRNKAIKKLRVLPEEGVRFLNRRFDDAKMRRVFSGCMAGFGKKLFFCGAGQNSGCVDAYGNLQACMGLRHPATVYNLREGSLEEGFRFFSLRLRKMQARNPLYLARCARCFLKGLCEQCPGKSWAEHGTLDTPAEYFCQVAHARARLLGVIEDGEKAWEVRDGEKRKKLFIQRGEKNEKKS